MDQRKTLIQIVNGTIKALIATEIRLFRLEKGTIIRNDDEMINAVFEKLKGLDYVAALSRVGETVRQHDDNEDTSTG